MADLFIFIVQDFFFPDVVNKYGAISFVESSVPYFSLVSQISRYVVTITLDQNQFL